MKTRTILNPKKIDLLFDHIIGGYVCSRKGIAMLKHEGHIKTLEDYIELVDKNQDRLIARIKEFRIVNRLLSVIFAFLFSYMQVNGDDL